MLAPNEALRIENVDLAERGAASKRNGVYSMGQFSATGTQRVISMYAFYRGASAPQLLIQTSGGVLRYTNDPTADPIVWTDIATGLSTTARMSFETFNSKCYVSNGVDAYASWDGTTYTVFPSAPKGKYLRLFKDTMWVSGITGTPDRVYSSNPGDAETFGVASWVDIAHGDGDLVTALGTDGLYLIVFKRNRTMTIYDPVTYANRVVDFEKGCESHFSVIQFENAIYFLSRRGICQYLGDSPSRYLSYKIDPIWDPAVTNLATLDTTFAYVFGQRIGWAVPESGSSYPTFQIEYYPRLADRSQDQETAGIGPFAFQRMPAQAFALWRSGTNERLFAGSNLANKVYWVFRPGQTTDDGVAFQGLIESKAYDFKSVDHTKYIRRVRLFGRGKFQMLVRRNFESAVYRTYPVDLTASADLWSASDLWGTGTWGPDSNIKQARINMDVYGRFFSLTFIDAEVGSATKIVSVGSSDYRLPIGEWTIFGVLMDGTLLGVRE